MSIADSTPSPVATLEAIRNYFNQLDADRVQFREWLSGEIDGGPNNDGYYPLTDLSGFEFLVPCPRLLESQIEAEVVANIGGKMSKAYTTWAALEATASNPLQLALVHEDTGTHIDPVTTAEVPNSGIYAGTPADGEWAYIMPIPSGSAAFLDIDDDPELAADSDELIPTQKAVKAYVDEKIINTIKIVGLIDCSTNPMFPAANKGDTFVVSASGLIGGAFGKYVTPGILLIANQTTIGGNFATAHTHFYLLGVPFVVGDGLDLTTNEAGNITTLSVDLETLGIVSYYRFAGFASSDILADEVLLEHEVLDPFTLSANLSDCRLSCGTNPADTWTALVKKNGVNIGSMSLSTTGVPTLTTTDGTSKSFVPGDIISLVAPSTADASIAGVRYSFKGTM